MHIPNHSTDSDRDRDPNFPELVETAFQMVYAVRNRYGQSRFELGLLLHMIKKQDLWVGKAENFWSFVDDLRINRNACRSYMLVASKFIEELQCSQALIAQLANCNFGNLEIAAKGINHENASDVISLLLALHERDAKQSLQEMFATPDGKPAPDDVSRLIGRYMELTDERRIEFVQRLRPSNQPQYRRAS